MGWAWVATSTGRPPTATEISAASMPSTLVPDISPM
jgi:hypothetical protein